MQPIEIKFLSLSKAKQDKKRNNELKGESNTIYIFIDAIMFVAFIIIIQFNSITFESDFSE